MDHATSSDGTRIGYETHGTTAIPAPGKAAGRGRRPPRLRRARAGRRTGDVVPGGVSHVARRATGLPAGPSHRPDCRIDRSPRSTRGAPRTSRRIRGTRTSRTGTWRGLGPIPQVVWPCRGAGTRLLRPVRPRGDRRDRAEGCERPPRERPSRGAWRRHRPPGAPYRHVVASVVRVGRGGLAPRQPRSCAGSGSERRLTHFVRRAVCRSLQSLARPASISATRPPPTGRTGCIQIIYPITRYRIGSGAVRDSQYGYIQTTASATDGENVGHEMRVVAAPPTFGWPNTVVDGRNSENPLRGV